MTRALSPPAVQWWYCGSFLTALLTPVEETQIFPFSVGRETEIIKANKIKRANKDVLSHFFSLILPEHRYFLEANLTKPSSIVSALLHRKSRLNDSHYYVFWFSFLMTEYRLPRPAGMKSYFLSRRPSVAVFAVC